MTKLKNLLKNYWIFLIIILQPILDIISYFQTLKVGSSYTWIFRIICLIIIMIYTFYKSNNKKKLILLWSIYLVFFLAHILNLYRIKNLNLISDTKYFIMVFQMPLIFIGLYDYLETRDKYIPLLKKGIVWSFYIIFISIVLSFVTNTYQSTYNDGGIIGWFSSHNTISMILCALTPWVLHISSKQKTISFLTTITIIFITLYTNGTKSCYLTLIGTILVILFNLFLTYDKKQKKTKIIISLVFLILSIFAFKYSVTNLRLLELSNTNENYIDTIDKNNKDEIKENENFYEETEEVEIKNNNKDNIIINSETENILITKLKTSYIYVELIDIHGEKKVLEALDYQVPTKILSDNRFRKKLNAKIEYDNSDLTTKMLGIGYSRIDANQLDLENDISAIFYYYGIIGFIIYISLPFLILLKMVIHFLKNKKNILDNEFIILGFIIVLLLFGGEYSGAFLRKANANIYLSIYLILALLKTKKKEILNHKKISFLLLHLGYGGIESSTINSANALCDKFEVEIISFYRLKDNQEKKLNKKINVQYLLEGGPNKEEFINSLKNKKIINTIKEGIESLKILLQKKLLIIKYIKKCDSKYIISTRVEFSELLSKYGKTDAIKIAQEHYHHNNKKKYIKKISKNYKKINYMCALTSSLKKDYKMFLKNNKFTKIILLPNMIYDYPNKITSLKHKNIISVGRLDEGKRINELIKIFSKIKDQEAKLFIIGDGKEYNNLEILIKKLKLEKRVSLLGYLDKEEIEKYMLKSSLFLMTSISEGLPMVLLEAMSYGVPCIAYETDSGVNDIIDNNKNGFIIKNRDEKEYIKCINEYFENYYMMKEFSNNAKEKSKAFSKEKILEQWNNILQ